MRRPRPRLAVVADGQPPAAQLARRRRLTSADIWERREERAAERLAGGDGAKVCSCVCRCACPRDMDVARVIEAGMPAVHAVELGVARHQWREMEEEGAPEGWPPDSVHYMLWPVKHGGERDVIADMHWRDAETASGHPLAEQFDALWVRRFRKVRGLR